MTIKWITATKGVRYKEHETRKHNKRLDRYFILQYKRNGKVFNEAVGWASEGVTQARCEADLATLKENWRTGKGGQTLKEIRELNIEKHQEEKVQKKKENELTLQYIYENGYLSHQISKQKSQTSIDYENSSLKHYIIPFFKDTPIKQINLKMLDDFMVFLCETPSVSKKKELSDSSKQRILAVLSQIFTYAQTRIDETIQNPLRLVTKPRNRNSRIRFLQVDEANKLLEELKKKSISAYNLAFISLSTGMRKGEILKLTWHDINFEEKSIFIRDPKNKISRHAYMTVEVEQCIKEMYKNKTNENLFVDSHATYHFNKAVELLEFNKGIDDSRLKICFHSLRHTFASWHAKAGTPIFTISKLLGHKSIRMTERYAHLCPSAERQAVTAINGLLS